MWPLSGKPSFSSFKIIVQGGLEKGKEKKATAKSVFQPSNRDFVLENTWQQRLDKEHSTT